MPIYEYECQGCTCRFEVRQGFNDPAEALCPRCQSKAQRVILPVPIVFKGSGFYITDHRKGNGEADPSAEKAPVKPPEKEPSSKPS
ncbi:MAG: zinc ribbon domain-containing protein [Chloroflexi bacterium]|nr:zinc ribbon domain-containing protein [Chloroflexota bacterium]